MINKITPQMQRWASVAVPAVLLTVACLMILSRMGGSVGAWLERHLPACLLPRKEAPPAAPAKPAFTPQEKYDRLPPNQKSDLHGKVYQEFCTGNSVDPEWGKHKTESFLKNEGTPEDLKKFEKLLDEVLNLQ